MVSQVVGTLIFKVLKQKSQKLQAFKDQFKIRRGSQSTAGFFFLSGFHMFSTAFNLVWLIVKIKLQPSLGEQV